MSLAKRYLPSEVEPRLQATWQSKGIYQFLPGANAPVYSIDTPPATVSGHLHLGHVYSYSHADFMARFFRMKGYNVFYPMGYDDNGLPTERLVEKRLGITAAQVGRTAFINKCLEVSLDAEKDYQELWSRLGLSIDWRYSYRTIDDLSRRTSQLSFIELYRKGLAYRQKAPAIWCPECHTAIAQAELNEIERQSEFVTLPFIVSDGQDREVLPVATTRPELLPACGAVFVHPKDERYLRFIGRIVEVPLFGQQVPVLQDPDADPAIGTGAVMCCTFGDTTDVAWWFKHKLPLLEAIDREGKMTSIAGPYVGLSLTEARQKIKSDLEGRGELLARYPTNQSVRVHERCDTPVEYIVTQQWFIRVLDNKDKFLETGDQIDWWPSYMKARYQAWVQNLKWDWCISRQRYFGVPFPLWYCRACGEVMLASEDALPIDPTEQAPTKPCSCGSLEFIPEEDILDTWATSSLSPQIVGRRLTDPNLFRQVFPFSLRPQAHEIIRTWAFYTIVKSHYHLEALPWKNVLISGWGLAGEGQGKISKSRGGGPMAPLEMIERYSADAVRYWAASTATGKDAVISEEKIQSGERLLTKIWNVARFSERFLEDYKPTPKPSDLSPADRWVLSRLQALIGQASEYFERYEYASAKTSTEEFFWSEFADNYLEMCKLRLYDASSPQHEAACYTLYSVITTLLKLFAPFLPYVTDEIYQVLFKPQSRQGSIHRTSWPEPDPALINNPAEELGQALVEIATCVRRYKSENNLSLGAELNQLQLKVANSDQVQEMMEAVIDLQGITRARQIEIVKRLAEENPEDGFQRLGMVGSIEVNLAN